MNLAIFVWTASDVAGLIVLGVILVAGMAILLFLGVLRVLDVLGRWWKRRHWQILKTIEPGYEMPRWYGFCWERWQVGVIVVAPIPLNVALRLGYGMWLWLRRPWRCFRMAEYARRWEARYFDEVARHERNLRALSTAEHGYAVKIETPGGGR